MVTVYILMTVHIIHWALTGRSIGRFVMSDSMETLELGRVNPGFLLFAAALLVSLIFGRFLCGWICHMGALQDLCAWILRRLGIRPRMFRSRLLGLVPFIMAFGMFIWPSLKREAVVPILNRTWPAAAAIAGTAPEFPGFSAALSTETLWDGLPSLVVAIPFLLLCGFGTVYFLGARGLCRYGCPYGGLLQPAERLAVGRVIVDMSRCTQCGLCTAACTAQVRVHDEVRRHGRVISADCVRSLECIAACPENALSFGFGRPVLRRPSGTQSGSSGYRLTVREEVLVGVVCLAVFIITRGLYGAIPMLMAATMGILAAFVCWRTLRLLRERDGRLTGIQLKRRGRLTISGRTFVAGCVAMLLLLGHSAAIRIIQSQAGRLDDHVGIPFDAALQPDPPQLTPEVRQSAERARHLYRLASGVRRGGIGLTDTPPADVRIAWLSLVLGDREHAAGVLEHLLRAEAVDGLAVQLAQIRLLLRQPDLALGTLRDVCRRRPNAARSRDMLCWMLVRSGRADEAEALVRRRLDRAPGDVAALSTLGRLLVAQGRHPEALTVHRSAVEAAPGVGPLRLDLAALLFKTGDHSGALDQLEAAARDPRSRDAALGWGVEMLRASGRSGEIDAWTRRLSKP